jgi:integrase
MRLTDSKIRTAKPAPKTFRMSDGGGLYLEITPSGTKTFRFRYYRPDDGKRGWMNFGLYPGTKLTEARDQRDVCRVKVRHGEDPAAQRAKPQKVAAVPHIDPDTMSKICEAYLAYRRQDGAAAQTLNKLERQLGVITEGLGKMNIREIGGPDILGLVRPIEKSGRVEVAHEIRSRCSQLFRFAIAEGRAKEDPARAVAFAMTRRKRGSHGAITDPTRLGEMLRAIRETDRTNPQVKAGLLLSAYLFPRSAELRGMKWDEIDWDAGLWEVPGSRMKMGRTHVIPLSAPAIAVLHGIRPLTGKHDYVLSAPRDPRKTLSDGTFKQVLTKTGFGEHTHHGFRTTFSTNMNEMGWNRDWIEKQLAHESGEGVRASYNKAEYLPDRVRMMHAYGEWLTELEGERFVIHRS